MVSWARTGVRVVCINDEPDNGIPLPIQKGERYTVSGVRTNTWIGGNHTTILLQEVEEPNEFWAGRFLPARERA